MKFRKIIYCLLTFSIVTLTSCGPDNEDYANQVLGEYNMKITPYLTLNIDGTNIPSPNDAINTTCSITANGDNGNVIIKIDGVNGVVNEFVMSAVCSGLGMNIDESTYKGIMNMGELRTFNCDFVLNNPTTTISSSDILNWDSSVTGKCITNISGLDMPCNVSGKLNFYAYSK